MKIFFAPLCQAPNHPRRVKTFVILFQAGGIDLFGQLIFVCLSGANTSLSISIRAEASPLFPPSICCTELKHCGSFSEERLIGGDGNLPETSCLPSTLILASPVPTRIVGRRDG